MGETPYFVELERALEICKKTTIQTITERVNINNSHERILAVDLPSKVNDPPFDNSAMDGFAMRYEDTLEPPSTLQLIGTIQASGQEERH